MTQTNMIYDDSNELEELFADAVVIEDEEEQADEEPKDNNGRHLVAHKCKFCGDTYYTHQIRSADCCKKLECRKMYQKEYQFRRQQTISPAEEMIRREKNRISMQKRRNNERDSSVERRKRLARQDKVFKEHGLNYGEYQKNKILELVPKIDVRL